MIRFLFRFLGLWMIAGAFVFFVYDGTKSIADRMLYFTKVSEFWAWVHQDSLLALQPAIERHFLLRLATLQDRRRRDETCKSAAWDLREYRD